MFSKTQKRQQVFGVAGMMGCCSTFFFAMHGVPADPRSCLSGGRIPLVSVLRVPFSGWFEEETNFGGAPKGGHP